jgi:hypothetical protein
MKDFWKQLADELALILKPHKFKRSGLVFTYDNGADVIHTIAVGKYRWNTPERQRFQLDLAVYLATGRAGEFTFKGRDSHFSLVFTKNVGYFWGEENHLFDVPNTDVQSLFVELRRRIANDVLPFVRRCTSIETVIDSLDQENRKQGRNIFSISLAIALARLGRIEESRKYFLQSIGNRETLAQMAQQYGVILDA